jgi:hypothetical protein
MITKNYDFLDFFLLLIILFFFNSSHFVNIYRVTDRDRSQEILVNFRSSISIF